MSRKDLRAALEVSMIQRMEKYPDTREIVFKAPGTKSEEAARKKFERAARLLDGCTTFVASQFGRYHAIAVCQNLANAKALAEYGIYVVR
jgi:hypothetical protein